MPFGWKVANGNSVDGIKGNMSWPGMEMSGLIIATISAFVWLVRTSWRTPADWMREGFVCLGIRRKNGLKRHLNSEAVGAGLRGI